MPRQHVYRQAQFLPRRGPRSTLAYHITRHDGRFLATDAVPLRWDERRALVFRSREAAEAFVSTHLASVPGIRVVPA